MKNSRAIVLLLLANSLSGVAQGISMLAIPWYFSSVLKEEILFGAVYFTVTFVSMFWGIYAGALVDRYRRKNLFLAINAAGLLILSGVSLYGFVAHHLPWPLVGLVFATTALIYNIHFPNLYAFAQEVTEPQDYGKVTSWLEVQGQISFALSGGFAAILLNGITSEGWGKWLPDGLHTRAWEVWEIFTLDALTYLIALVLIYRIRSLSGQHTPDTSPLRERIQIGFRFLKEHPIILLFGNYSQMVFLSILINSLYLMPGYISGFLQESGDVYAFSDMIFSVGALLAGLFSAKIRIRKNAVSNIILGNVMAGMAYLALMLKNPLPLFFALHFVLGYFNASIRIERITFLFHQIPNKVIGRTNSIFFVINVGLRLVLIGLFSLPFFHTGNRIIWAIGILGLICFWTAAVLFLNRTAIAKLEKAPV